MTLYFLFAHSTQTANQDRMNVSFENFETFQSMKTFEENTSTMNHQESSLFLKSTNLRGFRQFVRVKTNKTRSASLPERKILRCHAWAPRVSMLLNQTHCHLSIPEKGPFQFLSYRKLCPSRFHSFYSVQETVLFTIIIFQIDVLFLSFWGRLFFFCFVSNLWEFFTRRHPTMAIESIKLMIYSLPSKLQHGMKFHFAKSLRDDCNQQI